MTFTRREFLQSTATAAGLAPLAGIAAAPAAAGPTPLLKPVHDSVVCPWTPQHPRNDHQLIFPLDDARLMLVWSEYYDNNADPNATIGSANATDEVPCQIASMISTDRGRTWGNRRVLQPNVWKHNVKHPNLIRLSDREVLFFYVGWDSNVNRNVYMRRSLDNCETFGEQIQISEPGWYCNNADHALRLSTGRVILPAHGPYAENYIGGAPYKGGDLHAFVFYSDDGFKTWQRSSDSMTAKGRGCHEPTIVELKDGRLYCLLRNTNQCQYYSISEDGGDHWTQPAPTTLASPESPALLKRIPTYRRHPRPLEQRRLQIQLAPHPPHRRHIDRTNAKPGLTTTTSTTAPTTMPPTPPAPLSATKPSSPTTPEIPSGNGMRR